MELNLQEVTEVVNDLSKKTRLIPKKFEQCALPIIKHKVTFYFTASVKYNIVEKQFLQFIMAALPKSLKKEEIQNRLGITYEEMEKITNRLLLEQKIDVIEEEIHVKEAAAHNDSESLGKTNQFSRTFELYYEPVTELVVDKIPILTQNTEIKMHRTIVNDAYDFKNCSAISEDTILQRYEQFTGQDLEKYFSNIMIESIESKAEETKYKIELLEFELIDSNEQKVIKRLYNPDQHKLVEFS